MRKETQDLTMKLMHSLNQKATKTWENSLIIGRICEIFLAALIKNRGMNPTRPQNQKTLKTGFDIIVNKSVLDVKHCRASQYLGDAFIEHYGHYAHGQKSNWAAEKLHDEYGYYLAYVDTSDNFKTHVYSVRKLRQVFKQKEPTKEGGTRAMGHRVSTTKAQWHFEAELGAFDAWFIRQLDLLLKEFSSYLSEIGLPTNIKEFTK